MAFYEFCSFIVAEKHFKRLSSICFSFTRKWWVWRYFRSFFPIELVKTTELSPDKNYLIGSHPHGVLCTGAFCCFATDAAGFKEKFPGIIPRLLTLRGQFMIPGYREIFLSTGACAATKEGMEALFK